MRYTGTTPSGKDKDILVHNFTVGKEEMRLLQVIITHYYHSIPLMMETHTIKGRLRNMKKVLENTKI